jgi:cytochrome P450
MSKTATTQHGPPVAAEAFDIGSTEDSLERMIELFAAHGDIYRVFVPAREAYTYVVHHPEDVKRILVSNHRNYTKGIGLDRVKILLGNGIMTSEGEFWRRQRMMLQPLFHRRVITRFAEVIAAANDALLERWEALARRGEPVNLTDEMSELTLGIVLRAIFGHDLERMSAELGGNPFEVVTKEQARNLQFAYKFRSLTRLVAGLLARRRESGEEHFDYVAMLMNARDKDSGAPMSDRELIDEILTLVVAGHETTASGLNWTWYLLAQHPEVEAKLYAELEAASVGATRAPSLAQVEHLTYTRQVIDEALRLYPPGWLLSRRTIEPDVLSGYEIPAGANVLLPLYLLHRHPRYWKDPDAFMPERFAAEHEAQRSRFAYMPFAAGPRHCIGETFALYEMLMHVQRAARVFRLVHVPREPFALEAQINLRTRHPVYMRLERR